MLHCTKTISFPEWFPVVGGKTKDLFPPVFNVADSAITLGIGGILIWQKRFFPKEEETTSPEVSSTVVEENVPNTDDQNASA